METILPWVIFNIFVFGMLALDLGVFQRRAHEIKIKEALIWSVIWITLALIFNLFIYFWEGSEKALAFLAGYLIEKSLSVDNLFVFLLIFTYFQVPAIYQHRVLFWGVLGALVMRAFFIAAGVALITQFHWVIYVFGAFLIFTGFKLFKEEEKEIHPEKNPVLKLFKKFFPVVTEYHGAHFTLKKDKLIYATPLLVVLVIVETTDVVFALDSIPAILAISTDPFIVYSSNVFAILGLRALFFALAGLMKMFYYLNYGLAVILIFVGLKMVFSELYEVPISIALTVVAVVLTISILLSYLFPKKEKKKKSQ